MLGSHVSINNPRNPLLVTRLQNRNMRITVSNQKADIMFELYDPNQPIEQFNANITVPVRSTRETEYEQEIHEIVESTPSYSEPETSTTETSSTSLFQLPHASGWYTLSSRGSITRSSPPKNIGDRRPLRSISIPEANIGGQLPQWLLGDLHDEIQKYHERHIRNYISYNTQLITDRGNGQHIVKYGTLKVKEKSGLKKWFEDVLQQHTSGAINIVATLTAGPVNYYTGLPTKATFIGEI